MSRTLIQDYIPNAWNVICDTCGKKRKNFQCVMQMIPEMPNVFVCKECLDKHNQQYDVTGVIDKQIVPTVRDDNNSNVTGLGAFCDGYSAALTAANLKTNGIV